MTTRTILVADDDLLLRESLCDCLGQMGCISCQAGNGSEAISVLARQHCDLLMSDVDMPDMTGFQLLAYVHQHHPIPMVLMSARADQSLRHEARSAGAIELLRKPVAIASITSLFQTLFPQQRSSGR
jgi:CheY-like chemotaxis protein